eukprot:m.122193 g.122193  ORF g.122193 m.122193 type:complete len:354 (-) comp23316_c0_seq1:70-1131(-)
MSCLKFSIQLVFVVFFLPFVVDGLTCRRETAWPFSNVSVWNYPIGSAADYAPANIFLNHTPVNMHSDDDYFFVLNGDEEAFPWYDQGWWGNPGGSAHCQVQGKFVQNIPFNRSWTVQMYGNNNGAGILFPNKTLLQMQPLYRCTPGSPLLALVIGPGRGQLQSIFGDGRLGAHGGSGLSAVGGTIRLGELLPETGPITHALKLELYAHQYYYGKPPGYFWPANTCDGYAFKPGALRYNGTNPLLSPGSLLAIPPSLAASVNISTTPGQKILRALTDYGGYLVDDTAWDAGAVCTEHGVTDELQHAYNLTFNSDPLRADLVSIFRALSIVTNNSPTTIGGGGTPRAPFAPPFCS